MEDKTIELLNEISKNTEMGKNTVEQLLEITEDASMRHHLQKQYETYKDLSNRSHAMLGAMGELPKEQNPVAKFNANMGIKMKTMVDSSPEKMAEMLIKGSEMGIKDMQNALSSVSKNDTNSGAIALAQRLEEAEIQYRTELESFL